MNTDNAVEIYPLTPERWGNLEQLFGPRGACAGCWCMYWRLPSAEWERMRGEGAREELHSLVSTGNPPGLLAYCASVPVGWIAIAPREVYSRLERSRILKPVDDQPVWSVTCFFVARAHRRSGITVRLLQAAVSYAGEHGARIIEGYPVEPAKGDMPPVYAYTGLASAFRRAGFVEVARRSATRPIMRYTIS
ncbi:MAG TPA: GNAT family N-acetyltransferase [Ktedonobacterales bacterium]